jgi:predicted membrane-bound mannosyltransferase
MLVAKEAAALHFAALGLVAAFLYLARRRHIKWDSWLRPAVVAAAVFVLVSVALFSWFGANWHALSVLPVAARDVFARAAGEGHQKPVWYYAQLLAGGWSGWLVAGFAFLGLLRAGLGRAGAAWLALAGYGVAVTVLYSLIPYKTPWLALNLWLPEALLAGLGAVELFRIVAPRLPVHVPLASVCLMAALIVVLLAHDTQQRVFRDPAGESNPYAYAHTSEDLLGLAQEIDQLARQQGLSAPRIAVIAADPWPLPWYLRRYTQVGYWQPGQAVGPADFYITSTDAAEQYSAQLKNRRPDFFGARPGVLVLLWPPVSQ